MRNKIVVLSLTMLFFLSAVSLAVAQVEADVFVDLSVLDSLDSDGSSGSVSQPLFPMVSSASKARAASSKKLERAKSSRKKTKKAQHHVVVPPKADIKVEVAQPSDSIFKSAPAPVAETVSSAPVVPVVKSLPVEIEQPQPEVISEAIENPIAPVSEDASAARGEEEPNQPSVPQIPFVRSSEPVEVVDVEPASPSKTGEDLAPQPSADNAPQLTAAPVENPVESPEETLVKTAPASPLISSAASVPAALSFTTDISELTPAQKEEIDGVIATFENPKENKIAIYAYNLDDGVDVFRRKRNSLNRAVEVRSYLIQKGYKNFSIKVVNVDPGSEKVNVVEIEELK